MKQRLFFLPLLLALALVLGGCGESWTALTAAQMEEALCTEDELLQGNTLTDHGVLFDHGSEKRYYGYLDWWNPEVREYIRELYGDDALAILEEIADDEAKESYSYDSKNLFTRNRFANTAAPDNDAYDFILNDLGLFQAYRTETLTRLLRAEETAKRMSSVKRKPDDPIRVLLTEGSRYVAIDGKGIRSLADGDRTAETVARAKKIWSALTAADQQVFVLVSDPKAADVVLDLYVAYPSAGYYGLGGSSATTEVFGCTITLIAVDLNSDGVAERSFENLPDSTLSVRQVSSVAWMDLPELKGDVDAEAFMETIRSWYRDA